MTLADKIERGEATDAEAIEIKGYVSLFDVPDAGGDIVRRGAFDDVPQHLPLLWQHDPSRPIGRVTALEADERGLLLTAEVTGDTINGLDAASLIRKGAVDGLSFGYRVKHKVHRPGGGRELLKVEMVECSVVTLPMHRQARVNLVRANQESER